MQVDLLAFGAHPDDVEIGIGGTLIKHSLDGYTTAICDLTEAELSSNGTVERRKEEASAAGQILKVKERINLGFPDRGFSRSLELIDQITEVIEGIDLPLSLHHIGRIDILIMCCAVRWSRKLFLMQNW